MLYQGFAHFTGIIFEPLLIEKVIISSGDDILFAIIGACASTLQVNNTFKTTRNFSTLVFYKYEKYILRKMSLQKNSTIAKKTPE